MDPKNSEVSEMVHRCCVFVNPGVKCFSLWGGIDDFSPLFPSGAFCGLYFSVLDRIHGPPFGRLLSLRELFGLYRDLCLFSPGNFVGCVKGIFLMIFISAVYVASPTKTHCERFHFSPGVSPDGHSSGAKSGLKPFAAPLRGRTYSLRCGLRVLASAQTPRCPL